jgi:hypothetical protein
MNVITEGDVDGTEDLLRFQYIVRLGGVGIGADA